MTPRFFIHLATMLALAAACAVTAARAQGGAVAFTLSSKAFPNGGAIPKKFTCDGEDVSPDLSWTAAPSGTQSFVLIADDPDAPAGTWTHWLLYNLPSTTTTLAEGVHKKEEIPGGALQGRNDFCRIGYGGACPPPGKAHRYFFRLQALDRSLSLKPGAGRAQLEKAMEGHILGKAEWMGKYQR